MNRCFICGKEVNPAIDFAKLKDNGGNTSEVRSLPGNPNNPNPKYFCKEHLRQTLFLMNVLGVANMELTEEGL